MIYLLVSDDYVVFLKQIQHILDELRCRFLDMDIIALRVPKPK